MDKRFLQSIGLEIGLPRWKAYLFGLGWASLGLVVFLVSYVLFVGVFSK